MESCAQETSICEEEEPWRDYQDVPEMLDDDLTKISGTVKDLGLSKCFITMKLVAFFPWKTTVVTTYVRTTRPRDSLKHCLLALLTHGSTPSIEIILEGSFIAPFHLDVVVG